MRLISLLALGALLASGCSTLFGDDGRYQSTRSYPSSARVDTRGGEARYRMCHAGDQTQTIRERDVRRHLDHGDRFGACNQRDDRDRRASRDRDRRDRDRQARDRRDRDDDDRYERRDRDDRRDQDRYRSVRDYPRSARVVERGRVTYEMCHKGRTRTFNESAVRGHLNHGDRFGACRR